MNFTKTIFSVIATFFLCVGCTKSIEGNGTVVKRNYELNAFNQLDVEGDFKIILQQNPTSNLTFEMDENLIENIDFNVSGKTLLLKELNPIAKKNTYTVYIQTPSLSEINLKQTPSFLTEEGAFKADEITLITHQGAMVNASFDVKDFTLEAHNQSEITLYGETHTFDIEAEDKVEIDALNFEAKEVDMDISGTSELKLFVTKELSGSAINNATVEYREGNFTRDFRTKDQAEIIALKENYTPKNNPESIEK